MSDKADQAGTDVEIPPTCRKRMMRRSSFPEAVHPTVISGEILIYKKVRALIGSYMCDVAELIVQGVH